MTLAKDITLQVLRRPRHQKREGFQQMEGTPAKSTPGLQTLTANTKLTTCWVFIVLTNSYFHTVEKKIEAFLNLSIEKCQWQAQNLNFQDRGWAQPTPDLLKCPPSAGPHTCQQDTLIYLQIYVLAFLLGQSESDIDCETKIPQER